MGFSLEQLETELRWIDEHIGDKPYGVDTVIPGKYEGMGEIDPEKLEAQLRAAVPQEHRDFAAKLLADHGVPEMPEGEAHHELLGWTLATALPQVEEALRHDKAKLLAHALGTPPPEVIAMIHDSGRPVAALCGSAYQALRHKEAGVDIIIAQGYEGGGHTGEVGSLVLAGGDRRRWRHAGGCCGRHRLRPPGGGRHGARRGRRLDRVDMAHGQGGREPDEQKESYLAASSRDTVRSRSVTGKRRACCATSGPRPGSARMPPIPCRCRSRAW